MIYFNHSTYGEAFQISGTALTIGTSVADGLQSDYQKISN
jgi:hypothetical protein